MARKVDDPQQPIKASPAVAGGASDLSVLHPERTIMVAARTLEVREYGYIEGLKIQAAIKPFLDSLLKLFSARSTPPSAEAVREVFILHVTSVQWLMAQAITPVSDQPDEFVQSVADNAKWIHSLNDVQGDLLTTAWWEVNSGFFIRRLRERALAERVQASPSTSVASTPS